MAARAQIAALTQSRHEDREENEGHEARSTSTVRRRSDGPAKPGAIGEAGQKARAGDECGRSCFLTGLTNRQGRLRRQSDRRRSETGQAFMSLHVFMTSW